MNLTEETTRTLEVPGATLAYDVRPGDSPDVTPLFLIGSPMAAPGFGTLAGHFTDRTVITYDPREASAASLTEPDQSRRRPSSTATTCTGSSRSSEAVRLTCSPAAAAR